MTLDELTRALDETVLHRQLALTIESADADRLVMWMPMTALAERSPGTGQFHGGAIATLIDVAGDFVLMAALGHGVPTINFRVDYLRPASGEALVATALARRIGRSVGVVDIDVADMEGRTVAIGRGCYSSKAG